METNHHRKARRYNSFDKTNFCRNSIWWEVIFTYHIVSSACFLLPPRYGHYGQSVITIKLCVSKLKTMKSSISGIDDDRKSLEKKEIILKERKNCKRCASEINCIWQFIRWMFGCFFARRLKASKSAWDRNFRNGVASKNRIYELPFWWFFFSSQ